MQPTEHNHLEALNYMQSIPHSQKKKKKAIPQKQPCHHRLERGRKRLSRCKVRSCRVLPACARSARHSPITDANLKPWPEHAEHTMTCAATRRSPLQACCCECKTAAPSAVDAFRCTRLYECQARLGMVRVLVDDEVRVGRVGEHAHARVPHLAIGLREEPGHRRTQHLHTRSDAAAEGQVACNPPIQNP